MCCCGKPTINGQHGYKWNQPEGPGGVYPVNPPALQDDDELLHDEPGRCVKGLDAHCHHYRVVNHHGCWYLLVRHGGGDERIRLNALYRLRDTITALDTDTRYLLLHSLYHAHSDAARDASNKTERRWRQAAAEKRIKTRKYRGSDSVKVWIEDTCLFNQEGMTA